MARTVLTTEAIEGSTLAITASFTDEDGAAVVPNAGTIEWALTDPDGNVINDREQVAAASAASITVVLSGADLALQSFEADAETVKRRFLIEAEYDSDLGSDLTIKDECEFTIRNLTYYPAPEPF